MNGCNFRLEIGLPCPRLQIVHSSTPIRSQHDDALCAVDCAVGGDQIAKVHMEYCVRYGLAGESGGRAARAGPIPHALTRKAGGGTPGRVDHSGSTSFGGSRSRGTEASRQGGHRSSSCPNRTTAAWRSSLTPSFAAINSRSRRACGWQHPNWLGQLSETLFFHILCASADWKAVKCPNVSWRGGLNSGKTTQPKLCFTSLPSWAQESLETRANSCRGGGIIAVS